MTNNMMNWEALSEQAQINVVLGQDTSFPRTIAINMVPSSNIPNSADLLGQILDNDGEESKFRRLAAANLWRMNTPQTRDMLLRAASTMKNPDISTAIAKFLGRIGDAQALPAILAINQGGGSAAQASFAASLLAYRLDLPGHDLVFPQQFQTMPVGSAQPLKFSIPTPSEADHFIKCLAEEPFGIEFSKQSFQQFQCPGGEWMIAFNNDLTNAPPIETLQKRKTLMGVLAGKNTENMRYSVSYLILTSPGTSPDRLVDILIQRVTGESAWAGMVTTAAPDQAKFVIHTAGRIGVVPMEMEGTLFASGAIKFDRAVSTGKVAEKRKPTPIPAP